MNQYTTIIATLCGIASICGIFFFEIFPESQEEILIYSTYYFMMLLMIIWVWIEKDSLPSQESLQSFSKHHRLASLVLLIGTIILYVSVPFDLRVLADESNLISTSRSFLDYKTFQNSVSGKVYYDNYHSTHTAIPIRPPLFAFLLSIIHSLRGYAPENAGVLNLTLWMGLFILLYKATLQRTNKKTALALCVCICSIPILSLCARSGGFDVLSVFLLGMVLQSLHNIDSEPSDTNINKLWIYLLLFIHTRYENIVILVIIFPYLMWRHQVHKRNLLPIWILGGLFFLMPKWFQMRLSVGQYENEKEALLSIDHFWRHSNSFVKSLLHTEWQIPYNNLLNILGIIGCGIFCWEIYQQRQEKRLLLDLAIAGTFTAIFLAHFLGDPQNQTSLRFFLIPNITLGLFGFYTLYRIHNNPTFLMISSVALFAMYHPIAVRNEYMNALLYPREARIVYKFLEGYRGSNTMLFVDMPGAFVIQDIGALSIEYANINTSTIQEEYDQKLYTHMFVVQRIDLDTQEPIAEEAIHERFVLLPIAEYQTSNEYYLRIAEVIDIRSEETDSTSTIDVPLEEDQQEPSKESIQTEENIHIPSLDK